MIYIAEKEKEGEKTGIKQISAALNLPAPFLGKVLQLLAKQKILKSLKGPNGGFSMMKDPRKVTLYEVITTIDGKDVLRSCLLHDESCKSIGKSKKACPVHDKFIQMQTQMIDLFKKTTIYDIAAKSEEGKLSVSNS